MSEDATLDKFVKGAESDSTLELGPIEIELPTGWDSEELSQLFNLIKGNNYSGDHLSEEDNGGRIFLTLKSINKGGGFNWDSIKYYTGEVNDREIVEPAELLIANTDVTQDGDIVGYSIRVPDFDSEREIAASMDLSILRPRSNAVNLPYMEYLLQTDYIHSRMRAFSAGSTVLHLNTDLVESLSLPVPPLEEQRKIASVLYNISQAIQKTEELINQAERVKLGLAQDLLTHGINDEPKAETDSHFGQIPESWELNPLNEVGEIAGRTAPEKDESECWGGDIPWATPSEITSLEGPTITDTEEHLTEVALEKVSSNLLPPESVLLTTRATIGECAVNTVEMTTNQGFKSLIPGDSLDTWYAYYRLEYEGDYLASLSKGSTFPEVGKDTVENFVIPVPPLKEQKEIGERLKSVDDMILSYKSNKSQLQRLKQGLMKDLLSGTVRTTDTNIEVLDEVAQHG